MRLNYETLTDRLLELLPELRNRYDEVAQMWGEDRPGPHIVYGDILIPYLLTLLRAREVHEKELTEIFDFLESLADHDSVVVREVLAFSVLERLSDDIEWIEAALPFMGKGTRRLLEEVRKFWGQ